MWLALQDLDVVGQTRNNEKIGQLRAQAVVELGGLARFGDAEVLGLLAGVGGEEGGIVRALAHGQGDEALFGQLVFAAVGNKHLGGDLHFDVAQALVEVHGQILHRAAGTRADDIGRPAVLGETFRNARGKGKGRVAPEEVVVAVVHIFLVDKGLDRVFVRIVGLAQQEAGQGQGRRSGSLLIHGRTATWCSACR